MIRLIVKQFIILFALTAEKLSQHTGTKIVNIALTLATFHTASARRIIVMNNNYRENLESYLAAMQQAKRMLSMGILTFADYAEIDTIIAKKYGISSCSIYRSDDWIYSQSRVTI